MSPTQAVATQSSHDTRAPGARAGTFVLTSESVAEGHPDKVCDFISDAVLDAYLALDPHTRVACETLCKSGVVVLAGEIRSPERVEHLHVVRAAIRRIGYTDPAERFNADGVQIVEYVTGQSWEIGRGVDAATNPQGEQGAGDQGLMFGYASDETPELMPLPILLAHRLARGLAEDRHAGRVSWLRPDGKTQVSVRYENGTPCELTDVVVSTQHARGVERDVIEAYVAGTLAPRVLGAWLHGGVRFHVNPAGTFVEGGPSADAGLTGRKIIVDTYGGAARHGGGCFSGKDPSKVDRSGAYFARFVARQVVKAGLARRCEIQVSYAIGEARPVSLSVDTYGTGDPGAAAELVATFDFRPAAIIERLDLLRPIYRETTNYGHFGRPNLPWEQ
jgi:S-adenosylmethionine synthetase